MVKILKFTGKIIGRFFEWLLIFFIIFAFAIRTSPVQTFLAQQATKYLSKELNTTFRIDRVSIIFFHKVALDGVFVEDLHHDTIASIQSVFVTLQSFSSRKNLLALNEANLKGGVIRINRDKDSGDFNFAFIADYFSSDTPKKSSKPIDITLRQIKLTNVDATYDDNRKSYSTYGVDYDHLGFKNLFLTASDFSSKKGVIAANIKHISLRERSGFMLSNLSTQASVSPKGMKFQNLHIQTPGSKIYAPRLNFLMNSFVDFQTFVDSVVFDARLDESTISIQDISYFASALEGMDQVIQLEASVSNRVKDLRISNLKLKTGKKTVIEGNFNLPDFRNLEKEFIQEKITYAYVDLKDLQQIKFPKGTSPQHLSLGETVNRMKYFEIRDLKMDGFYSEFVVEIDKLSTAVGVVKLDHGVMFRENKNHQSFVFEKSYASNYDVKIDSLQLGKFLDQSTLGSIYGEFYINGEIFKSGRVDINKIDGKFSRVDFMDYAYKNVSVKNGSFVHNIFDGEITIKDENLDLAYSGSLDLNKQQHFKFNVDINNANLNKLKFIQSDTTVVFSTALSADISGNNINNYSGSIGLDSLYYQAGPKHFGVPKMAIEIERSLENDHVSLRSKVIDADLNGKVDFNSIGQDFNNQFSTVFPAFFTYKASKKPRKQNHFDYKIEAKDINDILAVFVPELFIKQGTTINGAYDGVTEDFSLDIVSEMVRYNKIVATGIVLNQAFHDTTLVANYQIQKFALNDTFYVNNVTFTTNGSNGNLDSELKWNPGTVDESYFAWKTKVEGISSFSFDLDPSYFSINEHRWDIEHLTHISFSPKDIHFDNFLLKRENQYISLNGAVSNNDSEQLLIKINDFQLDDFSTLIGLSAGLKGVVNGEVTLINPFDNLNFNGNAKVSELFINNQEVGEVNVNGTWDKTKEAVVLKGDLVYKQEKTFTFDGDYFINRDENNIDFYLDFDNTNIQFTNAFLDPNVVSNIKGLVEGKVHISGSPKALEVEGSVDLNGGNAKVAMFGVNFGFNGNIQIKKDMIAINNMPIIDEEGNTGAVNGTIYHSDFADWNFDIGINLDEYYDRDYRREMKVGTFLVMNTAYEDGSVYYGKAYATGRANISGYADNLDIEVNMKTEKNTSINFPMYGVSEVDEDVSFTWAVKGNIDTMNILPQIDLSGVNLNLNFDVTPDATIKLIFDDQTGDEITANGQGQIGIKLNTMKDLSMDGTYTVTKGGYNFVLSALKKPFTIQPGGTITWKGGGPTDADLNIVAVYTVITNVNEIATELETKRSSSASQPVNCNILLTGNLSEPQMEFEIKAPKASESARAALDRINSDKDELNKQFFSLLIGNKFQSTGSGAGGYGTGAALDALAGQINSLLDALSKDVRLNVGLKNDQTTGENSQTIGFTTNILNDKLTIKGNFGVENNAGGSNQSTFIGDLNLEYVIDNSGNLKVSIFNESNDYTVIQDKNLGPFTQGIGIQYQEEFQRYSDLKLLNVILDVFRKDKHFKFTKKRQQKKVPDAQAPKNAVLPEEKEN